MADRFTLLTFTIVYITGTLAEIPSYIHVCKRSEPDIDQCILNAIEELRPKLVEGIPELDVPSLEPLKINELSFSRGTGFRAVGTDINIYGCSQFEILSLKSDIDNLKFQLSLRLPKMRYEATYDVNAKILSMNIKGKGPIEANTTDVEGRAVIEGHKEEKDGKTIVQFDKMELKLKMKNYSVKLENLFNGDKAVSDAINIMLNENKRELMNMIKPRAEATVSEMLLEVSNKILSHLDYDEIFPA